jgi:hypothetical protein
MKVRDELIAETVAVKNHTLVYFNGAAWDKAGKITSAQQWFQYLNDYKLNLKNPVVVSIK